MQYLFETINKRLKNMINNIKIKIFIIWVLITTISIPLSLFAQEKRAVITVRNIILHGNIKFSDTELTEGLSFQSGVRWSKQTENVFKDNLVNWYNQRGYLFSAVDSFITNFTADSQFVDLYIRIHEGKCSYWGNIELSGVEGNVKNMIVDKIMMQKGRIFTGNSLENEIDRMLTVLENYGYPLAEIEINSLVLYHKEKKILINVELYINKGKLVKIDDIRISGNTVTKDYVITRESRLKKGEIYSHEKVLSLQDMLQRTGYFKKVEKPQVIFSKDKATVTLKVEEGTGNTMDGIIGYIPDKSKNNKGYFTGKLQFTFKNLLGTGRFLEAFWEKKDEFSQSIRFGYEEPWVLGIPLHAGIWFHQQIRDTTYVERKWNISARYQPWASLYIRLQAGQRAVLPDSIGSLTYNVPESHTWQFSGSIDYNTFDDLQNPQRGIHYYTSFTWGRKRNIITEYFSTNNEIKSRVDTRSLDVQFEAVYPLFKRQVLYFGLTGKEIKTGDAYVNIADQIRFGGARTLRGYEEDMFRGSRVAWVNCEYRSIVGYHSRIFLFVDSGFYQRKDQKGTIIRGYKTGYGFGIRLETRIGMIGIDYGLGEGDSLMGGKLHVGLVSSF